MLKKRIVLWILALLCLTTAAGAENVSGQRYDTFEAYYADDLTFINENDNRHLLPLSIASRTSDERDGRIFYEIFGDVLSMTIRTDPSGEIIEMCQIVVAAPQGMELGNAIYNDFAISAYHSYALLMAMDTHAEPAERYSMVDLVEDGLAQAQNGSYTTQLGVYNLVCTRTDNTVTMTFDNTTAAASAAPEAEETPEPGAETAAPVPENEDEGAGLG